MARIRIDLTETLKDGMDVKFQAPCACSEIDGITVYYPKSEEDQIGYQEFSFRDTHGNDLTGIGNLFNRNAYVKVILDTVNSAAYIQNADTNAYLESKFASAYKMELLWENASPDSTMAAGVTASVKLSGCEMVAIRTKFTNTLQGTGIFFGRLNSRVNMMMASTSAKVSLRTADVGDATTDLVTFNAGYADGSANTSAVIPLEIYGIQGVEL